MIVEPSIALPTSRPEDLLKDYPKVQMVDSTGVIVLFLLSFMLVRLIISSRRKTQPTAVKSRQMPQPPATAPPASTHDLRAQFQAIKAAHMSQMPAADPPQSAQPSKTQPPATKPRPAPQPAATPKPATKPRPAPQPAVIAPNIHKREFTATITKVTDGDGAWARLGDGREVRLRLHGIDALEIWQLCRLDSSEPMPHFYAGGVRARVRLAQLLPAGLSVDCHYMKKDHFGRAIVRCARGGQDIAGEMVRSGHALAFRQFSSDYVRDENEARRAKSGIWDSHFIDPWDWRVLYSNLTHHENSNIGKDQRLLWYARGRYQAIQRFKTIDWQNQKAVGVDSMVETGSGTYHKIRVFLPKSQMTDGGWPAWLVLSNAEHAFYNFMTQKKART